MICLIVQNSVYEYFTFLAIFNLLINMFYFLFKQIIFLLYLLRKNYLKYTMYSWAFLRFEEASLWYLFVSEKNLPVSQNYTITC